MNKIQIASLFFIATAFALQSCNSDEKQKGAQMQQETPVTSAVATKEIISNYMSYPSNVVPLQETEIRAEVSGYITNIFVSDGASVTKGQRLYEIDRTRYQAAVDQAAANAEIAKANLARVQKDLERYQKLAAQDAIAKQTLDYALTDLNNQKAQLQAAEAALITAKTNLQRSVIVAPFTGNIGISQVRNGALVSAGSTLLNTISSTNPIAVEFQISEKDIQEFSKLQSGKSSNQIFVSLPDGSRYENSGRISTIDRAIDRQTGTLTVRASFPNPTNALRAGMNATLSVETKSTVEEIVIPYKAIFEQLGTFNVYTISDSSTAVLQEVKLGNKIADQVVIKSGVQAGQKIIVDGATLVKPGGKVVENNIENQK